MNIGDVFETVARNVEDNAPAVLCDDEVVTWAEFDRRSNALARWLLQAGLEVQSKVGLYMRNGPDYLIAFAACFKARLCSFNINYRYGASEIEYLLDNADCEALIFDAEFSEVVENTPAASRLKGRIVGRGKASNAESLEAIYAGDTTPLPISRSSDDLFFVYTGGTTGLPKAVMWPSGVMWAAQLPGLSLPGREPPTTLDVLARQIRSVEGRYRFLVAPPLMHGTGLIAALSILFLGGSVVLSGQRSFDPQRAVRDLEDLRCDGLIIVGDAFASPILDVLSAGQGNHDVSHVRAIVSSGMMWNPEVKRGLLRFMPEAQLVDGLGASESTGFASSVTNRDSQPDNARFSLTGAIVLRPDDLTPVEPGSGEVGILAKAGPLPLGYYKDPERTARTYVTVNGERHVLGGDHAVVEADGTIRLLGRGSNCINTAGEKVYPEEVEEALKLHSQVVDALVVGLPHPRLGETVAALVAVRDRADSDALAAHVRQHLAGYKVPRRILLLEQVPRAPNGKPDYPAARALLGAAEIDSTT